MPCADILGRATFKVASPNVYYATPQSSPRLVFGSTECIQQRAECQWSPLVEFVRTAEPRARCAVDPCLQFVAQVALCRGRQCSCHFKLIGNTFLFQSLSFVSWEPPRQSQVRLHLPMLTLRPKRTSRPLSVMPQACRHRQTIRLFPTSQTR